MAQDETQYALDTTEDQIDAGFRRFYDEVEQALRTPGNPADPLAVEQAAQQLSKRLQNVIELQEMEERRQTGRAVAALAEPVRYLKAALADEVLLQGDWVGRRAWAGHLLETGLFRTSVAGDRVFIDIERVLSEREPAQRPLARLYLFALALGFQGRLRGQQEQSQLQSLRIELFQFVYQRQPAPSERQRPLSPQAYAFTLSHLAPKRQKALSRGVLIWSLVMLGMLLVSELLWLQPTWALRQPSLPDTGNTPEVRR